MKHLFFRQIIIVFALVGVYTNALAQSTFNSQTLKQAIISYVQAENQCDSKVEITQTIKPQKFSQSGIKASISHTENLIGNCSVLLTFYDGEAIVLKEKVRLNVRVYVEVPVALHFIGKDVKITTEDISLKKAEVTNIDPNSVVELSEAIGKYSKNGIAKGAVIVYSELTNSNATSDSEIIIKKNDKVSLLHYSGAILIRTEGVALENGAVGSVIKVKKDNTRTLHGFVAEDGNVIIEDKSKLTAK